jgi:short-subunit dehydrogenase
LERHVSSLLIGPGTNAGPNHSFITGPTKGGLGAQTAIDLAQGKPDKILLLGRTESKVTPVIEEIMSISPSTEVHFVPLDLASFKSIRNAAAIINNSVSRIGVLINNAGVMAVKDYTLTEDVLSTNLVRTTSGISF